MLCTTGPRTPPLPYLPWLSCVPSNNGRGVPSNTVYPNPCRWVLFEEKLELGAGRWSAPHVPTLALPSLQKLRSLLAEGLVLLDCPAQSFQELVGMLGAFKERGWQPYHFPKMSPQSLGVFQSPPFPQGLSMSVTGAGGR